MERTETFEEKLARVTKEDVAVMPYDPRWPEMFAQERLHLLSCLPGDLIRRIEHFGSTAVPGLSAKPIVDMLVEVTSLEETKRRIVPILEAQGYDYFWRPSSGDDTPPFYAWFIKRDENGNRTHHIHMVESHFEHWDRLFFRDYLVEHPDVAMEYGNLKKSLARTHQNDRIAYTQAKTDFVGRVTATAKKHYEKAERAHTRGARSGALGAVRRHPVAAYFVLTFVISWGGLLVLALPYGMPARQDSFAVAWPVVFLPYLMGPLLAGLVLTGVVHGAAGYKHLGSRLIRWRVALRYYAIAILTAPVLILLTLLPLSALSASFAPALLVKSGKWGVLAMGLGVGIFGGGLLEEPGWTGFVTPEMRRRRSPLATGVLLGMLWGAWHVLPTYWGSGNAAGVLDPWLFLPPCIFYLGVLPAYRALIVLLYEATGSLLVAALQHASLTACSLFILAPSASGAPLAGYYGVLAALMWATVLVMRRTLLAP